MSLHGSLHIDSTDEISVTASDRYDWITIWTAAQIPCSIHVDDPDTAERVARGFLELAAKMRERRHLPDSEVDDLVAAKIDEDDRRAAIEALPF